jgi:hypothetical protein
VAFLTQLCSEIDSCDFLFLKQINELDHNGLRLVIEEGIASSESVSIKAGNTEIADCHRVEPTDASRIFEILWESYVIYSVRNESFASNDERDVSVGRRFRIHSKSRFLDFARLSTFASEGYPRPIQHIGVKCEDHIVDVASTNDPRITRLWPTLS